MSVIWFVGQPGSGKTTLCKTMLKYMGEDTFHIDGDDLRNLFENKDYSVVGRRKNIQLAQQITQYLHSKGKNVLVSLVSPYKDQREEFKKELGECLVEVYVHTSEIRGREDYFVKEFEPPTDNYIDIDTTDISVDVCVNLILEYEKNSCGG
jgi:adenylylsulfate kinase-like enzyme